MSDGLVQTGAGGVEILEIQPESRGVMSHADYRRGYNWSAGARLQAIE
jgi:methionyl-tRNA formyltransferase